MPFDPQQFPDAVNEYAERILRCFRSPTPWVKDAATANGRDELARAHTDCTYHCTYDFKLPYCQSVARLILALNRDIGCDEAQLFDALRVAMECSGLMPDITQITIIQDQFQQLMRNSADEEQISHFLMTHWD